MESTLKNKFLLTLLVIFCLCTQSSVFATSYKRIKKKNPYAKIVRPSFKTKSKQKKYTFNPDLLYSKYSSWGVNPKLKSSINLKKAWTIFKKKKSVIVAVVDTGIDRDHPFLKHSLFVKRGKLGKKNFGVDFSQKGKVSRGPWDFHNHGTHVTGIIKSVYPAARILPLKYYNPEASGHDNLKSTIKALKYAVDAGVDIINYSGGGPEPAAEERAILKEAERKGIIVVAAAGNEKSNIDDRKNAYYPASYGFNNIITVTAYNKEIQILKSSNYGKKSVDIAAPGHRIRSSIPQGRAGYMTGTSQATAFVTGVVAMIKSQNPDLRVEHIKAIIRDSAKQEISLLNKTVSGGRLDATQALLHAQNFNSPGRINTRKLAKALMFKKAKNINNHKMREDYIHNVQSTFFKRAK